jgi:16S rRNA (adenine1518-N6/adenine1519-N6)-dimethyltransferase
MRPQGRRKRTPPRSRHAPTSLGFRAKKSLGQHFLVDEFVLDRIADATEVQRDEVVVEIGAGPGSLTERLAERAERVVAVEIDEALCEHLRRVFADRPVSVICEDVLQVSPLALLGAAGAEPPYALVGNLPYYITMPILRHFLEAEDPPDRMIVMVQKEVAQAIVAPPGKLSLMGVSVQFYGEPHLLFTVPPGAFEPPPKVESAVVRIDVRPEPAVRVPDVETFFEVVRAGFSAPRKQLHNALSRGLWLPPGGADDILEAAGVDRMRRAQTLSLEEWARIAWAFHRGRARREP